MSAQSNIFNPSQTTSAASGDGFSCPRLTTTGRLAISFTTADKGMMVYDTTLNNLFIWNGTAWESVPASGDAGANGSVQYNDNGIIAGAANLQYDKAGGFTSLRSGSALRAYVANNSVYSTISDLGAGGGLTIDNLNADGISLKIGGVNTNVLGAGTANWYDGAGVSQMAFVGSDKSLTLGADLRIWRGPGTGANNIGVGSLAIGSITSGSDNVGVGRLTGSLITTGSENVSVGTGSGYSITTGDRNVAIGRAAFGNNAQPSTGADNIAIGHLAMFSSAAITGSDNVGIGRDTFRNLSSGNENISIGRAAGQFIASGVENVAIGRFALTSNQTGTGNTAIGSNSLFSCVVGNQTAVGYSALFNLQSGSNNTAVGLDSLRSLVSNSNCTALGFYAGRAVTGADVTAIGASALALATGGTANTVVGSNSMAGAATTGGFNTCVGWNSGNVITSGTSNVCIGAGAGSSNPQNGSSNICIGRDANGSGPATTNELSLGSATYYVATNGAAATYFPTATAGAVVLGNALGFMRIYLNGTFVKIPVYGN